MSLYIHIISSCKIMKKIKFTSAYDSFPFTYAISNYLKKYV